MRTLIGFLVALLLAGTVRATEPPVLTDTDKLRVQVIQLMQQLSAAQKDANECRGQLAGPLAALNQQQIDQAVKDAKAAIDKAHPGQTWNPETGALTPAP